MYLVPIPGIYREKCMHPSAVVIELLQSKLYIARAASDRAQGSLILFFKFVYTLPTYVAFYPFRYRVMQKIRSRRGGSRIIYYIFT